MNPDNWKLRWEEGKIGFHSQDIHEDLLQWHDRFLPAKHAVLVPLCGKSVDMRWLAQLGHSVIGVEIVERAVIAFFAESGLTPQIAEEGSFKIYQTDNITVFVGDLLAVERSMIGPVDRVWDRAALVALPRETRTQYTAQLKRLAPGGVLLQNLFEYDESVMQGPPFSVSQSELYEHYGRSAVEILHQRDEIAGNPRWREEGHRWWNTTTALIQLPG